jgi:hypothetical protein
MLRLCMLNYKPRTSNSRKSYSNSSLQRSKREICLTLKAVVGDILSPKTFTPFKLTNWQSENSDFKRCHLDKMLGFNAFGYRKRFSRVEDLVVQDLEGRGFEVKLLEICVNEIAIGVKWIIDLGF